MRSREWMKIRARWQLVGSDCMCGWWKEVMKNVFESVDRLLENYIGICTSRFNGGSGCTVLILEGYKLKTYVYELLCWKLRTRLPGRDFGPCLQAWKSVLGEISVLTPVTYAGVTVNLPSLLKGKSKTYLVGQVWLPAFSFWNNMAPVNQYPFSS
jgi:hypothetical protein